VAEVGLETSGGTLIARATFDAPVDLSGTVQIDVSVSNDDSVSRGVLTNDGQTAVRDTLADNNPDLPTDYAYGSDGTAVSESDTALGTELKSVSLAEILQQSADTTTEWNNITSISDDIPLAVNNGQLELLQTAFVGEGEATGGADATDVDYSGGEAASIAGSGSGDITLTFTNDYTIPEGNGEFYVRAEAQDAAGNQATYDVIFDGTTVFNDVALVTDTTLEWQSLFDTANFSLGQDVFSGTHEVRIEFSSAFDNVATYFDVLAFVDNRYYFGGFDNTVHQDNGYLDEPQLYPSSVEQTLSTATFDPRIDEGKFNSTWNDTTGNQYVEVSPDGSSYTRFDNTSSATFSFGSTTQSIDTNLGLSGYPTNTNPQNATPRFGYNGQSVDFWELFINPDTPSPDDIGVTNARAIVPANSGLNGETIREAGLKSGATLLTRHQLAPFDVAQDQQLASSESTKFTGDD
jgi:hypothetical protein